MEIRYEDLIDRSRTKDLALLSDKASGPRRDGKPPGSERGIQGGASAGEEGLEAGPRGTAEGPYSSSALGKCAAEPWHNDSGKELSCPLLPCGPERA